QSSPAVATQPDAARADNRDRAKVDPRYPLQVTIRAVPGLPSLRSARMFGALRRAIGRASLAVNRALGRRKGKVVGDRYHVRPLTTPRQMRASMVYVLLNFRKHLDAPAGIDPRSSGPHFSGWHRSPRLESADVASGAARRPWAPRRPRPPR